MENIDDHDASPASTLDKSDPGDDVGARFRYQYCYAAIQSVILMSEANDSVAVYCENFEDILIEYASGMFRGVQVKTKRPPLAPHKAIDADVQKSLKRFCVLDCKFPGKFLGFDFVTNHIFWEDNENQNNLVWILKFISARGAIKGLKKDHPVRLLAEKLAVDASVTVTDVVQTLCKVTLQAREENINSAVQQLQNVLSECDVVQGLNLSYPAMRQLAADMIGLAAASSSGATVGETVSLYLPGTDYAAALDKMKLAGKCIDVAKVKEVIDLYAGNQADFEGLSLPGVVDAKDLPPGLERMVQKLIGGGVQYSRIQILKDLVKSFQYLYMQWIGRYGGTRARQIYEDTLTKVLFDCVEAQAIAEKNGGQYGAQMYQELFARLCQRVKDAPSGTHNCTAEQLMGVAGVLTEDCKAWWSEEFKLMGAAL